MPAIGHDSAPRVRRTIVRCYDRRHIRRRRQPRKKKAAAIATPDRQAAGKAERLWRREEDDKAREVTPEEMEGEARGPLTWSP
jgi:hypothetical protein